MSTQYPVDHQIMTVSAVEAFRGGGIEGFASVSALLPDGSQLRNPSSSRKPSRLYRLGVVEREREREPLSHFRLKHQEQLTQIENRNTCRPNMSVSCNDSRPVAPATPSPASRCHKCGRFEALTITPFPKSVFFKQIFPEIEWECRNVHE